MENKKLSAEKNHKLKKELQKKQIEKSRHYQLIKTSKKWFDDYYLDGIIGLVPIVGDIVSQFFSYSFLYISIVKLKSYRLTMAILFNVLIDILIGMIPYLGIVLDFVHHSYKYNFELIIGFVNEDKKIIQQVNKRAIWTTVAVIVLIGLIAMLVWSLTTLFSNIYYYFYKTLFG